MLTIPVRTIAESDANRALVPVLLEVMGLTAAQSQLMEHAEQAMAALFAETGLVAAAALSTATVVIRMC